MTDPDYEPWRRWREALENELMLRGVLPIKRIEQYTDNQLMEIAASAGLHIKHFREGK